MRILGVDPGLQCTGYGLIESLPPHCALVDGGVVRTDASGSLEVRLATLAAGLREIVMEHDPDVMVVEELYAKYRHPRTAILMAHARGVVLQVAAERGLTVVAYPASLVKRSLVGHGRASKQQVAMMVVHLLGLGALPQPDDVTDALALCLCHAVPMRRESGRGKLPPLIEEALARAAQAHPATTPGAPRGLSIPRPGRAR